jgi:hypothetical protein
VRVQLPNGRQLFQAMENAKCITRKVGEACWFFIGVVTRALDWRSDLSFENVTVVGKSSRKSRCRRSPGDILNRCFLGQNASVVTTSGELLVSSLLRKSSGAPMKGL